MDLTNKLSKSRYTKGLRCPLALYLAVHHYELSSPPSPEAQARMDTGTRMHDIAHGLFPGGVLIEDDYLHFEDALQHTQGALEGGAQTLFEAAFAHDNVKIRVDALRSLGGGGWELIEAKSTKSYDPGKHLPDAAIQLHVLLGCGIDVRRVTLLHLNGDYVYPGGSYDPQKLFAGTDITADAFDYLGRVPADLAAMMAMLAQSEQPAAPIKVNCKAPYECEFYAWCHRDDEEPDQSQDVEFVPAVLKRLSDLSYPLHFVDFETLNPALPIFVGTSPYQTTRVQWSIHTLQADGTLAHTEWLLSNCDRNPDAEFMATLLDGLPGEGTFVHYSPYERTQMVDIACRYPEFRQPLADRIPGFRDKMCEKLAERGISYADLRPRANGGLLDFDLGARVVKDGCLHPVFGPDGKKWSIKSAIKVLATDLPPYSSLAIGNGDLAMMATAEMLDPETGPERAAHIRTDLLAYCAQDTMSMVMIYESLRSAATRAGSCGDR
jgi:hypothetical protein